MMDKLDKFFETKYAVPIVFLVGIAFGSLEGTIMALLQGWRP